MSAHDPQVRTSSDTESDNTAASSSLAGGGSPLRSTLRGMSFEAGASHLAPAGGLAVQLQAGDDKDRKGSRVTKDMVKDAKEADAAEKEKAAKEKADEEAKEAKTAEEKKRRDEEAKSEKLTGDQQGLVKKIKSLIHGVSMEAMFLRTESRSVEKGEGEPAQVKTRAMRLEAKLIALGGGAKASKKITGEMRHRPKLSPRRKAYIDLASRYSKATQTALQAIKIGRMALKKMPFEKRLRLGAQVNAANSALDGAEKGLEYAKGAL